MRDFPSPLQILLLLLVAAGLLVAACDHKPAARVPGPLRIVVTVPPLVSLARELAPPGSEVTGLMAPGRSEHGYEFTPGDLQTLSRADIVLYVGLGLEPKVEAFLHDKAMPGTQVVCFAEAVGLSEPRDQHGHDHAHGHDHDEAQTESHEGHSHGAADPHLWLDTELVSRLLLKLAPRVESAARVAGVADSGAPARTQALADKVAMVDREYRAALTPFAGRAIVTHHNAWQRLADRYGFKVAAVIRPLEGSEPTPDTIAKAVEAIKSQNARAIFVEPQFNAESAKRIAEAAGATVKQLDPLGDGDWAAMMRKNLESLVQGLGAQ